MTALPPDVVADLSRENARLQAELRAARDRQNASADILRTIAGASGDAERSLYQIAETSARLFGATSATIQIAEGDGWSQIIRVGDSSKRIGAGVPEAQLRIGGRNMPGTIVAENRQVHVPDLDNVDPAIADWPGLPYARAAGTRSMSGSPLRREGKAIGTLIVYRDRLAPFTEEELALQQSFADQAAIAIENARLFNETREALERQTATAEILKVIASSPTDVQPVFEAIASSSKRLVGGFSTAVFRFVDGMAHLAAYTPISPAADEVLKASFPRPVAELPFFDLANRGEVVQEADTEANPDAGLKDLARARGFRSALLSPLMSKETPIGLIVVTRKEPGRFAAHHVQLMQTFADQAVIAIENVRLFEEVQARTRDLSESLQQQTATAEVLKVISRSAFDLQSVLDTLVTSASTLCSADQGMLLLFEGGVLKPHSYFGPHPEKFEFRKSLAAAPHRGNLSGRAVLDGQIAHVADVLIDPEFTNNSWQELTGFRAMLAVPLMRQGQPIGAMALSRTMPGLFADRQIELVTTFADQAVIAIENVRLFDEVQAKTRDLTEALTYQTGSSNILRVIASSPTDVGPVLQAIADSACELCEAYDAIVHLREGDHLRYRAHHGSIPFGFEKLPTGEAPIPFGVEKLPISRDWVTGRSVVDKVPVHLHDVLSVEGAEFPEAQRLSRREGTRTILSVPMLRESESIGAIVLRRTEVHPFSDKQINLLQTFADQAVIAIGNVRLFDEVQARTRELAASLDELRTAQDRLIQTEKLASLGQLTAGIAHEIKNPLNFVNNFAALSAELTDELNDVLKPAALDGKVRDEVDELTGMLKDNLEKVVQHGKRADSIVKNMLLHSREGSGDHRPADINALLDESLNLAYHGARAERPAFNVTLQRDFDAAAGTVEVFPQEITRVFLNLIANGFYAVAKRKAADADTGFDPILRASTKSLGDTVEIRIRDNGTGIPSHVKDKMFNPFFTTKPAGEGTGLGLSMSHDIIVKQHGGSIGVETAPGEFTEFIIVLPRASNPSSKNRGQT
jgi:two-component system NtrC family sensor kinase